MERSPKDQSNRPNSMRLSTAMTRMKAKMTAMPIMAGSRRSMVRLYRGAAGPASACRAAASGFEDRHIGAIRADYGRRSRSPVAGEPLAPQRK
jgi:hypothetical protein